MKKLRIFATFFSQGMLFTTSDCLKAPVDLVKLWLHEASRVYGDKLIEQKDMETFQKLKLEVSKGAFEVCKLPPLSNNNVIMTTISFQGY